MPNLCGRTRLLLWGVLRRGLGVMPVFVYPWGAVDGSAVQGDFSYIESLIIPDEDKLVQTSLFPDTIWALPEE